MLIILPFTLDDGYDIWRETIPSLLQQKKFVGLSILWKALKSEVMGANFWVRTFLKFTHATCNRFSHLVQRWLSIRQIVKPHTCLLSFDTHYLVKKSNCVPPVTYICGSNYRHTSTRRPRPIYAGYRRIAPLSSALRNEYETPHSGPDMINIYYCRMWR